MLGMMLSALLKLHGSFSYIEDVLGDWMQGLCSHFSSFPLVEKLYAVWACSKLNSPVFDLLKEEDKADFYIDFKSSAEAELQKRSIDEEKDKHILAMNDEGVDLVNGFFCREVCIKDGVSNRKASEFVPAFTTTYVKKSKFLGRLKYHLAEMDEVEEEDQPNAFWTLLFYVTHIFLVENHYFTKKVSKAFSELHHFISEYLLIAAQYEPIQMADSLSEVLLCAEMNDRNREKICFLALKLARMVDDQGILAQNDAALETREDLHSKLASAAALVKVLLFIDGKQ